MKVCIPASGEGLDAVMDVRLGRAAKLVFVDTDSGEVESVDNTQNLNAAQGAGIQTGQQIIDGGAEAVVARNVGPKAYALLSAACVKVYQADSGTVGQLVEQLKLGSLKAMGASNVEGHWA
ncbi:MAG: NifB/NifX family molybdenum-iron cluster-binding protein [Planctomycetes bacterium]|nr:NifB/NifX family molybdenum-iron cluster-binding protein [Planctomycetota bacterium]